MNSQRISGVSRKEDSVAPGKQMAVLLVEKDSNGDGKFHFHKLDQGFMQIATSSLVGSRLAINNNNNNKKKLSSSLTSKCFVIKHLPFVVGYTCFDCCFVLAEARLLLASL